MTPYEYVFLMCEPFLPLIHQKVRRNLQHLIKQSASKPIRLLDIGGRSSPYTVGLKAQVTIVDLPRESELQEQLNLGVTADLLGQLKRTRSNIQEVILEDILKSSLAANSFDGAVAVEVIEHILEDEMFLEQIARILKPGGWLYLTTPNGDYIRNEYPHFNPDHVRHYSRVQLATLLSKHFVDVKVTWGIKISKYRTWGHRSKTWRQPKQLMQSFLGNLMNRLESRNLDDVPYQTAHLLVTARRSNYL